MNEAFQVAPQPPSRGRPTKFTPERIQQINNLLERGKTRNEIANIIGVTTASLQVTCSKLGISLRQRRLYNGTGLLRRRRARVHRGVPASTESTPEKYDRGSVKGPEPVSGGKPMGEAQAETTSEATRQERSNHPASAVFAIRTKYKDEEQSTGLPLDQAMISQLALEAEIRGMRMGELVTALILAIIKRDLFQLVLWMDKGAINNRGAMPHAS